ncbi:MAG: hypothetical protein ACTHLW_21020 [Verrucomicrobiota bacterium]
MSKHTKNSAKNTNSTPVCAPVMGEYNGKPTITLKRTEDDKYPFTFGAAKARLIVEHFEAIKAFASSASK